MDGTTKTEEPKPPPPAATPAAEAAALAPCTLGQFLGYFLRLGTFGFGGPIALAGYMQRDLVEDSRCFQLGHVVTGRNRGSVDSPPPTGSSAGVGDRRHAPAPGHHCGSRGNGYGLLSQA